MKPIYVLNGPNLNRLGKREPEVYGTTTLAEIELFCREAAGDFPLVFRQTNSEEALINWVHEAIDEAAGILINPAAFSFTSVALLDALKMFPGPIVEFHISNIHRREPDLSPFPCFVESHCRYGWFGRGGISNGGSCS